MIFGVKGDMFYIVFAANFWEGEGGIVLIALQTNVL